MDSVCQEEIFSIQKYQGHKIGAVYPPPDRGLKQSFRCDLVKGGEVEEPVDLCLACLAKHIRQPALAGGDHEPASAAMPKAFLVRLAF